MREDKLASVTPLFGDKPPVKQTEASERIVAILESIETLSVNGPATDNYAKLLYDKLQASLVTWRRQATESSDIDPEEYALTKLEEVVRRHAALRRKLAAHGIVVVGETISRSPFPELE